MAVILTSSCALEVSASVLVAAPRFDEMLISDDMSMAAAVTYRVRPGRASLTRRRNGLLISSATPPEDSEANRSAALYDVAAASGRYYGRHLSAAAVQARCGI